MFYLLILDLLRPSSQLSLLSRGLVLTLPDLSDNTHKTATGLGTPCHIIYIVKYHISEIRSLVKSYEELSSLTHWLLGDVVDLVILICEHMFNCFGLRSWACLANLLSGECYRAPIMISQHWFRWWLGTIRHQAIIIYQEPMLTQIYVTTWLHKATMC